MKKKIFTTLFLLVILLTNISLASYSTVTMTVVEEPVCTIQIGENSKFEKRLISKDLNNKEVTLQLQVTNEETSIKPTGEIMLVLDNSDSMNEYVDEAQTTTRKDLIFESAKTLVSNLLEGNDSLQIGIVSFSSYYNPEDASDVSGEGTLADANVENALSNDVATLQQTISNIQATGARTDLDAGLQLATQQFTSEDNNKYMIVLTDGVPNIAVDYDNVYYSDDVIAKTNSRLQSVEDSGISLFTMLTGIDNADDTATGSTKTYGQIIEEIFGTSENPTAGHFYYVTDDQIETTITNDIYNTLVPIEKTLTDIVVVDYFPQEIIDNFEFAYVSEASKGDISATVDPTNNSITWTIPELASGETATVQYTLKLKEDFDSSIVGQILDTNEKVDISYVDFDGSNKSDTSDVTPKLKLAEPPATLPAAGLTTIMIALAVVAFVLLGFSLVKLTILNRNMKH